VARAVRRLLTDEKLRELLDVDTQDIGELKFDGADIGKLKAGFKEALNRAWQAGSDSALREIGKSKQMPVSFATLGDKAAEYFEANGFRMASNLTDGMRAIIQQELLRSVKAGEADAADVASRIYDRLIRKGFTTLDAVQREETRAATVEKLEALLADALGTENVPAYLETLVRTNTFEAMNEARFSMFEDPALEGLVVAYEYSAILDDRTTEICSSLDGAIYSDDSDVWNGAPRYIPPNHYNCRSLLIPIFSTDQWDGIESAPPSVEPQEGFG
jgi:SPP1 gp7 family putative phage head morphogenesis protein